MFMGMLLVCLYNNISDCIVVFGDPIDTEEGCVEYRNEVVDWAMENKPSYGPVEYTCVQWEYTFPNI